MLLLLARHGNTFEVGEKPIWVGARTDLPLTAKGKDQAKSLGAALAPMRTAITRIVAGPLQRTREHAEIAAGAMGFQGLIETDIRLREIDYGLWEGKSSDEIMAMGAEAELKAWNERATWPSTPDWRPLPEQIKEAAGELARQLAAGCSDQEAALAVTSNGVLRFFLALVPGGFEEMAARGALKVATGHCCVLLHEKAAWRVLAWNRDPCDLPLQLGA